MAPAVTRRTFLTGTAAVAGAAGAATLVRFTGLETLEPVGDASAAGVPLTEDAVPTTCWIGKQDCGLLARRVGGRVVKLEGDPLHPRNLGTLCPKGEAQLMALYDPNRVKTPLLRTNEKGVPGKWRRATWDEALDLVADRVKEVQDRDPHLVLWQKGRSKAKLFYDEALLDTTGWGKLGHGTYCSDAGYRAAEYTVGAHGVLGPDLRSTRYLLSWGWNVTNGGGNQFCFITWNRHLVEARRRGLKVVAIDPRLRGPGPFADEWLPIRPATDLALALALAHELVKNDTIDRDYLVKYTNATHLVGADGHFVRDGETELVWDTESGEARPAAEAGVSPALEGEYEVDGATVRTAFELYRQGLDAYTPEWAAEICGIEAARIARIARELAQEAMIGSTVNVEGVEVPYRPVAIMAYHMAQQELGFQTIRAMLHVMMLLGAVGAVGGQRVDVGKWTVDANYEKLDQIEIGDPPYSWDLKDSKFYPINSKNPGVVAGVILDPERYEVEDVPEVAILHMANPLGSFTDSPRFFEAYKKIGFVAVIDPWLSRTADLFADVVLPAATLEKYEGPASAGDQYVDGKAMRVPPIEPLFESRGEIDIYIDLLERLDLLTGESGYIAKLNESLELAPEQALPLDSRPDVRDIFDRWAKTQEIEGGIEHFEKEGAWVKGPLGPDALYGYALDPPFGGAVHRLYGDSLLRYAEEMEAKGADEIYWRDYTPLPVWREPTMWQSPEEYDLTLISYKLIEHKQSRSLQIPLLAELSGPQRLEINPATARRLGIADGDGVVVESHNAVTDERRSLETVASLRQSIHPEVVGMPHHFGEVARHPWTKGQGPSANELFFAGEGYVQATADNSFHVRVKVRKA